MGILEDFIKKKYGIRQTHVTENPLLTEIGTTAERMLRHNRNRIAWLIVNMSVNTVYVAFSPNPSVTKGIALSNGDSVVINMENDASLAFKEVWLIANGAASAIYNLEVVAE